jgi:hypothetical protein
MADGLSELYQDLLTGTYDCVDRIILNAYFRMGHSPGGFHVWWRALTGSDDTLDNTHLMRLAGRFSRRLRGYAKAHGIPVIDAPVGFIFLILTGATSPSRSADILRFLCK